MIYYWLQYEQIDMHWLWDRHRLYRDAHVDSLKRIIDLNKKDKKFFQTWLNTFEW